MSSRRVLRRESQKVALKKGKFGRPVLAAAKRAPAMTTESVIRLLEELR